MFVVAHELYDALPIHQFKYLGDKEWCEKVIKINEQQQLEFTDSEPNNENVKKVLQPKKLFSEEALKDLKAGDTFELCPMALNITQQICSLVEVSKGAALIVDYGEDHAFSNSFRGIKEHKLVKDWNEILKHVGTLDLTAYVNFKHIQEIVKKQHTKDHRLIAFPPIP